MAGSKPAALPLGDIPTIITFNSIVEPVILVWGRGEVSKPLFQSLPLSDIPTIITF
ncbi:hypothetical protein PAUR_a2775 [Pseudoalteromonas aurantia 208]|uniref:Uncharacterized protein n=1 Tax=Pseudoalteromonas aurantia 208 TaxID=1314867 RepID=A0ABR9EE25_9GAMM|nr:hypothetical protein [Pseudoalteromonas aurantia 208]